MNTLHEFTKECWRLYDEGNPREGQTEDLPWTFKMMRI